MRHELAKTADSTMDPAMLPVLPTVLLVEDEEHLRLLTRRILERSGFRVFPARHALEGLEILGQQAPDVDVVLSDVLMPRMDGITFAEQVRLRFPNLPVVLMSGQDLASLDNVDVRRWSDGILPKPFTTKQLVEILTTTTTTSRQ